jgi:exonuclease III
MITSWNVRGLNKGGKLKEISSRLRKLQPTIAIILETRVKAAKADKVREQLKLRGCFLDNYHAHPNGRIWVVWDDKSIDVRHVKSTSQMIHCGVYDVNGDFQTWMTAIYAHNQPAQRKILWKELDAVHRNQQGPWFLIGDFNNVIKSMDRIGGNLVTEHEFADLNDMMNTTGLFEKESIWDYYTWTNKHTVGTIYSRIDHVLGNLDWLQANLHRQLEILAPMSLTTVCSV